MNKKIFVIVGAFIAAVAAASAYILLSAPPATTPVQQQDSSSEMEKTETATEAPKDLSTSATEKTTAAVTPATYVAYDEQAFASEKGTKVLFFHAPWCPQCRDLDREITNNISSLQGPTIYKVDYDSSIDLRKKYDVTLQTTLVKTDEAGNKQTSFVAYDTPNFAAVKQNLSL